MMSRLEQMRLDALEKRIEKSESDVRSLRAEVERLKLPQESLGPLPSIGASIRKALRG